MRSRRAKVMKKAVLFSFALHFLVAKFDLVIYSIGLFHKKKRNTNWGKKEDLL